MGKKKIEEKAEVMKKVQVGNYIVSEMADESYVLTTVSGKVLGIYLPGERQGLSLSMWFNNIEEESSKILITTLCMNLQMAHDAVIVEPEFVEKVSELYSEMYKRVRDKIDNAGKEVGIESPSESDTTDEILDEVETLNDINQSGLL